MSHHVNIVRLKAVANALKKLKTEVVFVGGATVSLYANHETAAEVRPTADVDVVIELLSYTDYSKLDEKLRAIGFINDIESGVICRYRIEGIVVDIMPTTSDAIGFSNKWYPDGFKHAIQYTIDEDNLISIFSLPYFIAAKLEAFRSRGKSNYRFSSDFEDIVYVLENAENLFEKLYDVSNKLRYYLVNEFKLLLADPDFEEGLYAHLEFKTAQFKSREIINVLTQLVNNPD